MFFRLADAEKRAPRSLTKRGRTNQHNISTLCNVQIIIEPVANQLS